jgi:type I restriction enzyme S subunit
VSWKNIELAKVCEVFADGDWIESKDQSDIGIRLIQTGNVGVGRFKARDSKARYISEETFKRLRCTEIKEGDLLVSRLPDPVGRACIIPQLVDKSITAVDCTIIRTKQEILYSNYLNYYCQSPQYFEQVKKNITGATRQRISRSLLGKTLIPLAPIATQQKIVTKLDSIFSEIDVATAAAEANAKNAKAIFQSFLKETFNNSKKQSTKIKLESIANITSSKRIMKHEYVDEGIPFYRTKEVKELANKRVITTELFISKENYNGIKSKFGAPKKGEILITAIGTIGEIYVIDTDEEFYFKDGNVLWVKDLKEVQPEFLKYVLMSFVNELNELSLGAAYSALPIHKLKNYEVLIPNLEHQRILILAIQNMESYSNKLTMDYIEKISLYSSLKQSILQQAFSGELVKD